MDIYEEETKKQLAELQQNVGRKVIIRESSVSGITGKKGTIVSVLGKLPDGFRYEVRLDNPIALWRNKDTFYPPVFLVDILKKKKKED